MSSITTKTSILSKTKSTNHHIRKNQDAAHKLLRNLSVLIEVSSYTDSSCTVSSTEIRVKAAKEVEI